MLQAPILLALLFISTLANEAINIGPWTLLNVSSISTLSLNDMSYKTKSSTSTIILGSFDTGPFSTLNSNNMPQTVPNTIVDTALYLPAINNKSGAWITGGYGMVISASLSAADAPSESHLLELAKELGIPILSASYNNSVPHSFGYKGMNGISAVTLQAMPYKNPCNISSVQNLAWGNFNIQLAKKQLFAITVLQRLVQQHLQISVTDVAVSGSSKDGAAVWASAFSDARIKVASPMHDQAQNLTAFLNGIESSWKCEFACKSASGGTGSNGTAAMVLRKWFKHTIAGQTALNILSPSNYYLHSATVPDFVLIAGDVGGCDMHDGHHFPLGIESIFLDALAASSTSIRYQRCSQCPMCAACPGSHWNIRRVELYWVLGQRLINGLSFENTLPKVMTTTVTSAKSFSNSFIYTDADSFTIHATGSNCEKVTLWYSPSTTRIYNDPKHLPWTSVPMSISLSGPNTSYVSPTIEIPLNNEVAWYVNCETTMQLHRFKKSINVSDSSPIRIETPRPAQTCPVPSIKFC